jgi:hypothetical protein
MALYKYSDNLKSSTSTAFDDKHSPGVSAPHAGIYQCVGCGDEIGIAKGHTLPSQNHAQHSNNTKIEWKLLVYAEQKS